MKKFTLVMIILWSFIALIIVGVIVVGVIKGGSFGLFSDLGIEGRELLLEQSFSAKDFDKISLTLTSDEITIFLTDDQEIRIKQYGINLPDSRKINFSTGSGLRIYTGSSFDDWGGWIFFSPQRSWIELYIPENYKDALDISLSSGSVKFQGDLELSALNIRLSSGVVRSDYLIRALETDIQVTSGTIRLLGGLRTNWYEISASSGNITVESELTGSGEVEVTSGTIKLEDVNIQEKLKVRVTSGTVNLQLAGDPGLDFNAEVSSGTVSTYFETTGDTLIGKKKTASFGPKPRKQLDIKVTSGTVRVTN